jgi:hypothetical protein
VKDVNIEQFCFQNLKWIDTGIKSEVSGKALYLATKPKMNLQNFIEYTFHKSFLFY